MYTPMIVIMPEPMTVGISILALLVSGTTAWLTLFRRGTVKMTQPTTVFLGGDGKSGQPKVYLRTLLYSTSKRGRIIESMYAKVRCGETTQNFNVWVYGEDKLARGSGLFVGETGIVCNHHFVLPKGAHFKFSSTEYVIEVYANLVGNRSVLLLHRTRLSMPSKYAVHMRDLLAGVHFDWGPDSGSYHAHIRPHPGTDANLIAEELAKQFGFMPEPQEP